MKQVRDTREQQADRLWKGFHPDKEKAFWKKYDALLKSSHLPVVPIVGAKAISPPVGEAKQVFEPKKNYSSALLTIIVGYTALGLIYSSVEETNIILFVVLAIVFAVLVLKTLSGNYWSFSTSTTGLYATKKSFSKEVYFTWDTVQLVELIENGYTSFDLVVQTKSEEEEFFSYNLSKKDHELFFKLIVSKKIKVACCSKGYKQFGSPV